MWGNCRRSLCFGSYPFTPMLARIQGAERGLTLAHWMIYVVGQTMHPNPLSLKKKLQGIEVQRVLWNVFFILVGSLSIGNLLQLQLGKKYGISLRIRIEWILVFKQPCLFTADCCRLVWISLSCFQSLVVLWVSRWYLSNFQRTAFINALWSLF